MKVTTKPVRVIVRQTKAEVVQFGARKFADVMKAKPDFVGGVGTGSTLESCGREIVALKQTEGIDVSRVHLFGLDEYLGWRPIDFERSYTSILWNLYCRGMGLPITNMHLPYWNTQYPQMTCAILENEIDEAGGINLQLLGLGVNGHVAFNEPGVDPALKTHVEALSQITRTRNSVGFDTIVPERAMTQGIATIRRATALLLMAYGAEKADAAQAMLFAPPSRDWPASLLMPHPDLTAVFDLEAASLFPTPYNQEGDYEVDWPCQHTG